MPPYFFSWGRYLLRYAVGERVKGFSLAQAERLFFSPSSFLFLLYWFTTYQQWFGSDKIRLSYCKIVEIVSDKCQEPQLDEVYFKMDRHVLLNNMFCSGTKLNIQVYRSVLPSVRWLILQCFLTNQNRASL